MKGFKVLIAVMAIFAVLMFSTSCVVDGEPSSESAQPSSYVQTVGNDVIITVSSEYMTIEAGTTTLKDYMDKLVDDGAMTYAVQDPNAASLYITTINGTEANGAANEFWALYTDDSANSNLDWGTYDFGEKTLASATYGMADLKIVDGCLYAWHISSW